MKVIVASALTLLVVLLVYLTTASPQSQVDTRPNIIFILTDDQRYDTLGVNGNNIIKTPALDRLASDGTAFDNAFVVTSVCAANRAVILSGNYGRTSGIRGFAEPFNNQQLKNIYPARLRENGYYTGFIGKWGVGATTSATIPKTDNIFDFWRGYAGQGNYYPKGKSGPHMTALNTEQVEEFLSSIPKNKPFNLSISFKAPHGPWRDAEPEIRHSYESANIPFPATLSEEVVATLPDFIRTYRLSLNGQSVKSMRGFHQKFVKDYYALISGVDRAVGNIRTMLEQKGLAENTVIVFTSDNGHFLHEFGIHGKWLMYEPSIHVPLIVYDPRIPKKDRGKRVGEFALSIDIAPTLLDLAGVKPTNMQGQSLVPLLKGSMPTDWREDFFYEYNFGTYPGDIPASIGVRDHHWKYIQYVDIRNNYEQLFNLDDDPDEKNNLAYDSDHSGQLDRLRERLEVYRSTLPDNAPDPVEYKNLYKVVATGFQRRMKTIDLNSTKVVGQSFIARGQLLSAVQWILPDSIEGVSRTDHRALLYRGGPTGELIKSVVLPKEKLYALHPVRVEFNATVTEGETLYFELRPYWSIEKNHQLQLWAFSQDTFKDGQAWLNGKPQDYDMIMQFLFSSN